MVDFIPINGKLLLYGLTWVTISHPKTYSPENIALFRSHQTQYVARYLGETMKVGLAKRVIETAGEQPKGTLLSAALLFAAHPCHVSTSENSVLIHQINETKVAVIALLCGVPYLDVVIRKSDLEEQLASLYQEGHAPFVVYGNVPEYTTTKVPAESLLSGETAVATLTRFTDPVKWAQRTVVVATLALALGGIVAWKINKTKQDAAQETKKMIGPVEAYTDSTQQLLAAGKFNGNAAYESIWPVIRQRDIDSAGWSLRQIQCKPTECTETWRQGYGTLIQLTQHLQPPQTIQLQPDGESAVIRYPIIARKSAINREALPEKDKLWLELVAQQQRMKRLLASLVFAPKPPQVRGLTPTIMASSVPADMLLYSGEMAVTAPLGFAGDLLQHYLDDVMIGDITLTNFDDIRNATIQIKGVYYARN